MGAEASPAALTVLGRRLEACLPPSLSALASALTGWEDYIEFQRLVREFLPQHEKAILGLGDAADQVGAFAQRFGQEYFPLHGFLEDGDSEGYQDLVGAIPCVVLGFSPDDYHELPEGGWRPGYLLLAYLVSLPRWWGEEEGARVALAEACAQHVPQGLLAQVREGGYPLEELRLRLDGTRFDALARWAEAWEQETGNFFLDTPEQAAWEGAVEYPDWTRENVTDLTEQWRQARAVNDEVHKLAELLEAAPASRFQEIVHFLNKKAKHGDQAG